MNASPMGPPRDGSRRFDAWGERVEGSIRQQDRWLITFAYIWWIPVLGTAWTGIGLLGTLYPVVLWIIAHNDQNMAMAFHARQALALQAMELAGAVTVLWVFLPIAFGGESSPRGVIAIYAGVAIFLLVGIVGVIAAVSAMQLETLKLRLVHLAGGRLLAEPDTAR